MFITVCGVYTVILPESEWGRWLKFLRPPWGHLLHRGHLVLLVSVDWWRFCCDFTWVWVWKRTEVPPTSMRTSLAQRPPCPAGVCGSVALYCNLTWEWVRKMSEVPPTSMRTSPAQRPPHSAGVVGLVAFITWSYLRVSKEDDWSSSDLQEDISRTQATLSCWCPWIGGIYTVILPECKWGRWLRHLLRRGHLIPAFVRGLVAFILWSYLRVSEEDDWSSSDLHEDISCTEVTCPAGVRGLMAFTLWSYLRMSKEDDWSSSDLHEDITCAEATSSCWFLWIGDVYTVILPESEWGRWLNFLRSPRGHLLHRGNFVLLVSVD